MQQFGASVFYTIVR